MMVYSMKKIIIAVAVLFIIGGIVFADEVVYCENIAEKMEFFGDKRNYLDYLFDDNYNSHYFLRQNYSENMLGFFNKSKTRSVRYIDLSLPGCTGI